MDLDTILKILGVVTTISMGVLALVMQGQRRKADLIAKEQEDRAKRFEALEDSCNTCRLGLERDFVRKVDLKERDSRQELINRELYSILGDLRVDVGRNKP